MHKRLISIKRQSEHLRFLFTFFMKILDIFKNTFIIKALIITRLMSRFRASDQSQKHTLHLN